MKLKDGFLTQNIENEQILIAADSKVFRGIVKNNETAAFIVDALKKETTKQEIAAKMLEIYDVTEDVVNRDIDMILSKLRGIGALDE